MKAIFSTFLRSFFLQSAWNFERMQNVGFAYCILPLLKKIYPEKGNKESRLKALERHLEFFNTHPYMSNILVGLTVALEEQLATGNKSVTVDEIKTFKSNMSGPLAALGDTFFWATLRPFCALIVVCFTLCFIKSLTANQIWLLLLVFLIVYNSIHFAVRYLGLLKGYQLKTKVVTVIAKLKTQNIINAIRIVGLIIAIFTLTMHLIVNLTTFTERILFLLSFSVVIYLIKKEISYTKLFYGITV
ncbi:MAG: PTS system mannose/fructose/sorbose family transporter subunit IID, partial [Elusimicrobiota bacterium]|nr:PTS system mannose/fructose/sorbose family transporter subunit IID [Elusimicrobiota bacterium]